MDNISVIQKADCSGCHSCYNTCNKNAITMEYDSEGFLYPVVNDSCVSCGACLNACPVNNPPIKLKSKEFYACFANDTDTQKASSSGGLFALLASEIIKNGGYAFGAAFDNDFSVCHIEANSIEELNCLKGSKYVQSKIGQTYKRVKKLLLDGNTVLFSGTPCQIAGLNSFLKNKSYDNLICVDLICHGVPSPAVWQKYLKETCGDKKIEAVLFRDKKNMPKNEQMTINLTDGNEISCPSNSDLYKIGFIKNLYLRRSCFNCHNKGIERSSDITIGDFWGINDCLPNFSNGYGVSSCIIRTEKGKALFDSIKDKMTVSQIGKNDISLWNECLLQSVAQTPMRNEFYEIWQDKTVKEAVLEITEKYKDWNKPAQKTSSISRIKSIIRRIIK